MKRRVLFVLFSVGMFFSFSNHVLADGKKDGPNSNDGVITNWGVPKEFSTGKITAYWLWYDNGVWHFRTTSGAKGLHRFNGQIEVFGGKLIGLKGKSGEYVGKGTDSFVFNAPMNVIKFDFRTGEGVDGLNFAVEPGATQLRFTLAIDGDEAPKHIRIGKASDHPNRAIFTTPAHPPDPPDVKKPKKK